MLWLFLFACDGEERELEEQEDAAYAAGCDVGQVAGTLVGQADGSECRERSDVPLDTAEEGMVAYCGGEASESDQPCYWWKIGYLDCWRASYDMSYPTAWHDAGCDDDSGS
jgi:hypothetical protein